MSLHFNDVDASFGSFKYKVSAILTAPRQQPAASQRATARSPTYVCSCVCSEHACLPTHVCAEYGVFVVRGSRLGAPDGAPW